MRTMTIKEYVLEQLNERLAKEGKGVRIVSERSDEGKVVELRPNEQA